MAMAGTTSIVIKIRKQLLIPTPHSHGQPCVTLKWWPSPCSSTDCPLSLSNRRERLVEASCIRNISCALITTCLFTRRARDTGLSHVQLFCCFSRHIAWGYRHYLRSGHIVSMSLAYRATTPVIPVIKPTAGKRGILLELCAPWHQLMDRQQPDSEGYQ